MSLKWTDTLDIAIENSLPVIHLVDAAGGFLPLQSELFPDRHMAGRRLGVDQQPCSPVDVGEPGGELEVAAGQRGLDIAVVRHHEGLTLFFLLDDQAHGTHQFSLQAANIVIRIFQQAHFPGHAFGIQGIALGIGRARDQAAVGRSGPCSPPS